ncbi:MAG: rhomboid family intramembrane serine protease [Candidatus Humimicrobiia bacterium]
MVIPISDDYPTKVKPFLTFIIIAFNIILHFWVRLSTLNLQDFINKWGFSPSSLALLPSTMPIITMLSSMFLHGNFLHLLFNMWFLWIFGDNIEDAFGHLKFLIFYFLCGIVAILGHTLFYPQSSQPIIGASGAISGVMAAYLLLYWKSSIKVLMFFTITKIPALIFIALWFIYQVVYGMGSLVHPVSLENVGWFAHIGGFLMGIALTILLPKNPKRFIKKYRRIEI